MPPKKTTVPSNDTIVDELFAQVQQQKAEIAAAESPKYRTNRIFRYLEEDTNRTVNLAVVNDVTQLLKIAAHVQGQHEFYNQAAANIIGDEKATPPFTWCGFSLADWLADIKAQVSKIRIKAKQEKLAALEARLDKLVSPEKRAQMELAAIRAELKQ
jgi:hypothetical protein